MYIPRPFQEPDRERALAFIDDYGFATLVSWSNDDGPMITHLPLLLDRSEASGDRLLGHVARANDHWQLFDGSSAAVAIFHGPHAYISPAWYETPGLVPTWNYAVVHAHGAPRVLDDAATQSIVERLIAKEESGRNRGWTPSYSAEFMSKQLRAIVGFELPIARLETKFKLSQNRNTTDRDGALRGLEREATTAGVELATFMRSYLEQQER